MRTNKRVWAPSKKAAEELVGGPVHQLVHICLMVPNDVLPNNNVVHRTGTHQLSAGKTEGTHWVTACNAKKKPAVVTTIPKAANCQKCLEWVESLKVTEDNPLAKSLEEELASLPENPIAP